MQRHTMENRLNKRTISEDWVIIESDENTLRCEQARDGVRYDTMMLNSQLRSDIGLENHHKLNLITVTTVPTSNGACSESGTSSDAGETDPGEPEPAEPVEVHAGEDGDDVPLIDARIHMSNCNLKAESVHVGTSFHVHTPDDDLKRSILCSMKKEDRDDAVDKMGAMLQGQYKTQHFRILEPLFLKTTLNLDSCISLHFQEQHCARGADDDDDPIKMNPKRFSQLLDGNARGNRVRSVLVQGSQKIGKSVFCRLVAYSWAQRKVLDWFRLLFYVHATSCSSVKEILLRQLKGDDGCDNLDDDQLYRIVDHEERVLILIDCYDGLDDAAKREVMDLVSKRKLPRATVVVVCRDDADIDPHAFEKHFVIRGLGPKETRRFFQIFLSADTFSKLMQIITHCGFKLDRFTSPALLSLFCHVVEQSQELLFNPSLTAFVKRVFDMTFDVFSGQHAIVPQRRMERLLQFGMDCHLAILQNIPSSACRLRLFESALSLSTTHPIFMATAVASYLVMKIQNNDFGAQLKRVLRADNSPHLCKLLFGLAEEDALLVLKALPYKHRMDLCFLVTLLNENNNVDLSSILTDLPEWLVLSINKGFEVVSDPISTFNFLSSSETSMFSVDDHLLPGHPFLNPILHKIMSHPEFKISQFLVSVDIDSVACGADLFLMLAGNTSIETLTLNVPNVAEQTVTLLKCLDLRGLRDFCLVVDMIGDSELPKELDLRVMARKLPKIESLRIVAKSGRCTYAPYVLQLLGCYERMRCVEINGVSRAEDLDRLAEVILRKKVEKLRLTWNHVDDNGHKKSKINKKSSETPLLSLCESFRASSHLSCVDFNNSVFVDADITCLLAHVGDVTTKLDSLALTYCMSTDHKPLEVELTKIAPPTKTWKYLNLSACAVTYDGSKWVGRIDTLKIHSSPVDNVWRITKAFSVQNLHCDGDTFVPVSGSVALRPVKTLCIRDVKGPLHELNLIKRCLGMENEIRSLKVHGRLDEFAADVITSEPGWYKRLTAIHFCVKAWEHAKTTEFWKLLNSIACSSLCLERLKLTMVDSVDSAEEIWSDHLAQLLSLVHASMTVNAHFVAIEIVQPTDSFAKFMEEVENWETIYKKRFKIWSRLVPAKRQIRVVLSDVS